MAKKRGSSQKKGLLKDSLEDRIPSILTELPGPEARKVLEKDQRFISQSYTRVYPLVVKRARGAVVEDGKKARIFSEKGSSKRLFKR
jgi:hypothetical protein